jgi:hypothetical protein
MDWIADTERLVSISQTCLREELPYISLVFMFVGKGKEVVSVVRDTIEFSSEENQPIRVITKEKQNELVEMNKKENYKLRDTLLFHIPLEPEVISLFHEDSYGNYMTSYPTLHDILLPPSIFIFHPYNTLYFIYFEIEDHIQQIKSALRQTGSGIGKLTKRVRWGGKHRRTRGGAKPPLNSSDPDETKTKKSEDETIDSNNLRN